MLFGLSGGRAEGKKEAPQPVTAFGCWLFVCVCDAVVGIWAFGCWNAAAGRGQEMMSIPSSIEAVIIEG